MTWPPQRLSACYPFRSSNTIGRAAVSTIVLDLPEVSRLHARIRVSSNGATLEDLSSRNGTFVGGVRIMAG